jgi:hypothetical protein
MRFMGQFALLICGALSGGSCADGPSAPTAPTPAAVQTTNSASDPPAQITSGSFVVSGVITQVTAAGPRPLEGALANAWIQQDRFGYSHQWAYGKVVTDAAGRYELRPLPSGVTVRLEVWKEGYVQQCAAPLLKVMDHATVDAQLVARANVSGVPTAVPPPAPGFRLITGTVFERTSDGLRPFPHALVDYEPVMDSPAAVTYSDENGRYVLCGISDTETAPILASRGDMRVTYLNVPPGQSTGVDIVLP